MKFQKKMKIQKTKEDSKAIKKEQKMATQQLPYVQYTSIQKVDDYYFLHSKSETVTCIMKINGMNLSNITDRDFEHSYVSRLLRCISFFKKGYIKVSEVPLSFSNKLAFCKQKIATEENVIKRALWEDDQTLFQVLDDTKEKHRSFFLFLEENNSKDLILNIKSVTFQLKQFGIVPLSEQQLKELVKYINNSGGIAPHFETI